MLGGLPLSDEYWAELNTVKLSDNDATTIQAQADPTHIQADNIGRLASIKLVNDASLRDGKAMPGTGVVQQVSATTSGEKTLVHTPNSGEVWELQLVSVESVAGGSGSVTHQLYIAPVEYGGSQPFSIFLGRSSSSAPIVLIGYSTAFENSPGKVTYDENTSIYYEATRSSLTNSTILVHRYRIR
jgi:hypothetical protein